MRGKNYENVNENGAGAAVGAFLTKLSLAALLGAVGWILYSALSGNGDIKIYLRSLIALCAL